MSIVLPCTNPINRRTAEAAVWAAVASVAADQFERYDLPAGTKSDVALTILATVDGVALESEFAGHLTVGHNATRSSTANPEPAKVLAAILGKLNAQTRESFIRDLPAEFEAAGCDLPHLEVGLVEQAEGLLSKLRASKRVPVCGSVKFTLDAEQPTLAIAG